MRTDNFGNTIFDSKDVLEIIYQDRSIDNIIVESSEEIAALEQAANITFIKSDIFDCLTVKDYDTACQQNWFMPDCYYSIDIEDWLYNQCEEECEVIRIQEELVEFKKRNMMLVLRYLKYLVDMCRTHNVVWGVGRGSSVASYTLFLLGVHKINSIKYDLDWQEFLHD